MVESESVGVYGSIEPRRGKLPRVLFPESVHFVYRPESGARGSKEAREKLVRARLMQWLMRQDQTTGGKLRPGDFVYLELEHHSSGRSGPSVGFSQYGSNFYLHEVVEHAGELKLRNLARIPAAPAASGVWLQEGTLMPISTRKTVYRVFPAWL